MEQQNKQADAKEARTNNSNKFEGETPASHGKTFLAGPNKAHMLKDAKEAILNHAGMKRSVSAEVSLEEGVLVRTTEEPEGMDSDEDEFETKFKGARGKIPRHGLWHVLWSRHTACLALLVSLSLSALSFPLLADLLLSLPLTSADLTLFLHPSFHFLLAAFLFFFPFLLISTTLPLVPLHFALILPGTTLSAVASARSFVVPVFLAVFRFSSWTGHSACHCCFH